MKVGDIVQVRRFDGSTHWVFAVVADPATNRVVIAHPGNSEDGATVLASPADIRTKADVQRLIDSYKSIVATVGPHGLTEAQIRELAALDGFWAHFLPTAEGKVNPQQPNLHRLIGKHYMEQLKALS